jgi:hypothetical protein
MDRGTVTLSEGCRTVDEKSATREDITRRRGEKKRERKTQHNTVFTTRLFCHRGRIIRVGEEPVDQGGLSTAARADDHNFNLLLFLAHF